MTRVLLLIAAAGFLVAVVCFAAAAQLGGAPWGSPWVVGPTVTRDYDWNGGDSLRVDAPADVEYTQGPITKLTISGPKGLVDRLTVRNGRIGFDGWMGGMPIIGNSPSLKIVMTAPNVTDFNIASAQTLSIANYRQDNLGIELSGAGEIFARGQAKRAALHISGTGSADLGALAADDVTVRLSGAGDATIAPKLSADVGISGVGDVTLLTRPAKLVQHISGLGSVNQLGGE